jgi:hypothetical protein
MCTYLAHVSKDIENLDFFQAITETLVQEIDDSAAGAVFHQDEHLMRAVREAMV